MMQKPASRVPATNQVTCQPGAVSAWTVNATAIPVEESSSVRASPYLRLIFSVTVDATIAPSRPIEEARQVRVVRHVEEYGQYAGRDQYEVQLGQREYAEPPGDRDRREQQRAEQVGVHEDRSAADAVGPGAGEQTEAEPGGCFAGPEQRDLQGGRVQIEDGEQGDRAHGQPGAELTEQVGGPQAAEIRVSQDAHSATVRAELSPVDSSINKVESTGLNIIGK